MKCAIIGATGYTSLELTRLINGHPELEIIQLISESKAGASAGELYPHMNNYEYPVLDSFSLDRISESTLLFLATPSGVSTGYLEQLNDFQGRVVDLSGDLRIEKQSYEKWYGKKAVAQEIQRRAVYGLTEVARSEIRNARLISNPGCYATAVLLGLLPFLKKGLIAPDQLIISAASGITGAGKSLTEKTHHARANENVQLYKIHTHQHIPEIEQVINEETGLDVSLTFLTHLLPINRGIMATMVVVPTVSMAESKWREVLEEAYAEDPFIRVRLSDPEIKSVVGSNYCDLSVYLDERTGRLTIVSVIDNMLKGAAGQAVQNANLMLGFDETAGLTHQPTYI
ncbi:N-acetyl-gamma-glutamyl-phosphate reductase [Exiguobacterium flavidum]|uniref:N-acetyl-gamma-glutamyl-phosphate reductase n=1 Tax=Exiguobacterium flavidum TaxID=2184695 RepID=UPI000DF83908|nr:N-acetyl-gamma-glutamyl-phosphate reductase [Exiguobacterium flavidum]